MHFSIPDTQEINDKNSTYSAYNISVNGVFHCVLRYRQLHHFHEQLRKAYGISYLPFFPPKKLLPLTLTQIEERRTQIEKFIQVLSQDSKVLSSELFAGFFLNAQQETRNVKDEHVNLDVNLMNGQTISISVKSTDRTSLVLESAGQVLKLPSQYLPYFTLFVAERKGESSSTVNLTLVRRLQNFEAPYLTLLTMNANVQSHCIVIRKTYWDSSFDEDLSGSQVALGLIYKQVVSEVERGWIQTTRDNRKILKSYQERGDIKQYIELSRTLRFYGYIHFESCFCNFPHPSTPTIVSMGGKELLFREYGDEDKETSFRVTRIRCWRLTTAGCSSSDLNGMNCSINGTVQASTTTINTKNIQNKLELSFEYLMNKDVLRWVTIVSDQAILISICLQGMVEELLRKRKGLKLHDESSPNHEIDHRRRSWNYMKRDGSSHQLNKMVRSVSNDSGFVENNSSAKNGGGGVKGFKYNARKGSLTKTNRPLVENDCFEGIGDDDL